MADVGQINVQGGLQNGVVPCEGPRIAPYIADFSLGNEYSFDFTQIMMNGQITSIQTVFIDNSANGQDLSIVLGGTRQSFKVAKNSQGWFTLLAPANATLTATTSGLVKVYFGFINFYVPPTVWSV